VTVHVRDMPDEPPVFRRTLYEATVPENRADVDVIKVEVKIIINQRSVMRKKTHYILKLRKK
jgi:hypothetical protein